MDQSLVPIRDAVYEQQPHRSVSNENKNSSQHHHHPAQHRQEFYSSFNHDKGHISFDSDKPTSMQTFVVKGRETTNPHPYTTIRRADHYSHIISFNTVQHQHTNERSDGSTLANIEADLVRNKTYLVTNQGSIRMKEYTIDGYTCRCDEQNHALNDDDIDNEQHVLNYKIIF